MLWTLVTVLIKCLWSLGITVRPFAQMFETELRGRETWPSRDSLEKASNSPRGSHTKWVQAENPQMSYRRNKEICLLSFHRAWFLWASFRCQFLSINPFYGVRGGFQVLACFWPALVTPTSLTPNLDTHVQSISKLQDVGGAGQPGSS